jgi:protein-ribulosamine 3-kinase
MDYVGIESLELGAGNNQVDPNVRAGQRTTPISHQTILTPFEVLPPGCQVISTAPHGTSFFAKTGRIDVKLPDGTPKVFFIKVLSKEVGKNMVHGEFEAMKAIYKLLPDFAPEPIAWGTYEMTPDTHFFLCEFRDMTDDMPDPHKFTSLLAKLHQNGTSPNGKFGFHVTTYSGNLPQMVEWEDNWERFFAKSMRCALDHEIKAKGHDPEFDVLVPILFNKVIPRLLRPLESEGRKVKPALVHGDLWYANSGKDVDTDTSLIFDACSFYAHNECKAPSKSSLFNISSTLTSLTHIRYFR